MDQQTTQVRQEIETTREALTQKLTMLEERARGAMQSAKETVQQVTDVNYHVDQHPWTTMGVAVLTGYTAGRFFSPASAPGSTPQQPYFQEAMDQSLPQPASHHASFHEVSARIAPDTRQQSSAGFSAHFQEELSLMRGAAVGAVFGLLSDLLRQALPNLRTYLKTSEPQSVTAHSTNNLSLKDDSAKRRESSLEFPLTPVP